MSLILRKECQDILNGYGLDMLHVGVRDRYMQIVGQCGQTILAVQGIQFNSRTVTKAEISLGTELFAEFMKKHNKEIRSYMDVRIKLKGVEKPTQTEFGGRENYSTTAFAHQIVVNGTSYSIQINNNPSVVGGIKLSVSLQNMRIEDYKKVIAETPKAIEAATKYFEAINTYNKNQKTLGDLARKISSCSI